MATECPSPHTQQPATFPYPELSSYFTLNVRPIENVFFFLMKVVEMYEIDGPFEMCLLKKNSNAKIIPLC